MKVLFLDDNGMRHIGARNIWRGDDLLEAYTAEQAINILKQDAIDYASLDHDLRGVPADSNDRDCGMEVVRWIVANRPAIGSINVHSWNGDGSSKMVSALRESGYSVGRRRIGNSGFEDMEDNYGDFPRTN